MSYIPFQFAAKAAGPTPPARGPELCDLALMKSARTVRCLGVLATLLAGSVLCSAAETNDPAPSRASSPTAKLDFSSFKSIADRNIFDGNRSGQVIRSTRSSSPARSVRVQSFTLVGTLISEKGAAAFFDGTDGSYQKTLKSGETIAGFQVKDIVPAGVRLRAGTNEMELCVGNSMRREDEGLWKPSTAAMTYASAGSSYPGNNSSSRSRSSNGSSRGRSTSGGSYGRNETVVTPASSTSSEPLPAAEVNEVLKRLMEKREQEKQ
jgi:hypothetical protein